MGYIIIAILVIGDLWLYLKGGRQENTIWRDETIRWMK